MPGKRKWEFGKIWAKAMRPIDREGIQGKGCWECTARAKSDIYDSFVYSGTNPKLRLSGLVPQDSLNFTLLSYERSRSMC